MPILYKDITTYFYFYNLHLIGFDLHVFCFLFVSCFSCFICTFAVRNRKKYKDYGKKQESTEG